MSHDPPESYRPFPNFPGWAADFDPVTVEVYAARLADARAAATPEAMEAAVNVATRYAAVDTGAIEGLYATNRGFTRTIAEQTATWEAALRQHGPEVARSIGDALNGYEMVLDLVTQARPLTEAWIRRLHEVLCASQEMFTVATELGLQEQPLPKGSYKLAPNNPTNADTGRVFHYAPPIDTPAEMARLVAELASPEFLAAHPVVQAAYAHYAFVRIHPFADGNGRVARALAAVFLYRRPGVPLVIFADQKTRYLDALEAADQDLSGPFVAFVAERAIDTIELVRMSLGAQSTPAAMALEQIRRDLAIGGEDRGVLATRVRDLIEVTLPVAVSSFHPPAEVSLQILKRPKEVRRDTARLYERTPDTLAYVLQVEGRLGVAVHRGFSFWAANDATTTPELVVLSVDLDYLTVSPPRHVREIDHLVSDFSETLDVLRREVSPSVSEALRIKVHMWLTGVIAQDLQRLAGQVHRSLRGD